MFVLMPSMRMADNHVRKIYEQELENLHNNGMKDFLKQTEIVQKYNQE